MTWAPSETQKAIYTLLSSDAALMALLGQVATEQKVFDFIPDNTAFPYIQLQIKPWTDRGSHQTEGFTCVLTIHVWYQELGRGDLQVQNIQARVDQLLHTQDVCITGWNVLGLRRTMSDILTDPDNVTKHGIQQFKLLIGEK